MGCKVGKTARDEVMEAPGYERVYRPQQRGPEDLGGGVEHEWSAQGRDSVL